MAMPGLSDPFSAMLALQRALECVLKVAKENTIRISGTKALNYEENASIHRRERSSSVGDRTISLP